MLVLVPILETESACSNQVHLNLRKKAHLLVGLPVGETTAGACSLRSRG